MITKENVHQLGICNLTVIFKSFSNSFISESVSLQYTVSSESKSVKIHFLFMWNLTIWIFLTGHTRKVGPWDSGTLELRLWDQRLKSWDPRTPKIIWFRRKFVWWSIAVWRLRKYIILNLLTSYWIYMKFVKHFRRNNPIKTKIGTIWSIAVCRKNTLFIHLFDYRQFASSSSGYALLSRYFLS